MLDSKSMQKVYAIQKQMHDKFRNAPKDGQTVEYLGRKFIAYPGVFWPHEDSKAIVKNYVIKEGETVLDLCTGSGVIAIFSALKGAKKVVALDINPDAIKCVKENSKSNGVARKVDARVSDMFVALEPGEKFNVITMNPPFTPHKSEVGDYAEKTVWDSEFHVHNEFFKYVKAHLKKGGRIYLAQASFGGVEIMLQMARDNGFNVKKIGENKVDELRTFYAFELKPIENNE